MSKTAMIPEDIKRKIEEESRTEWAFRDKFSDDDFKEGAEFGYSLSQSKIQELEKENERLRGFEQKLKEEFLINTQNYPKEYHNLFIEKFNRAFVAHWQQFKETNNL